ncbi:hypothetical protein ACJ41P_31585 [Azospirillum argentinense]|uniref:Uncharacterized protein n=1 Tax=Azospirillum argentinense TaxID=2970906 RepID=A0ABW8VGY5_9PROT
MSIEFLFQLGQLADEQPLGSGLVFGVERSTKVLFGVIRFQQFDRNLPPPVPHAVPLEEVCAQNDNPTWHIELAQFVAEKLFKGKDF